MHSVKNIHAIIELSPFVKLENTWYNFRVMSLGNIEKITLSCIQQQSVAIKYWLDR